MSLAVPAIDADADTLTAALTYAENSWYVLPIRTGTKHPGSVVGTDWQDKSSRDPDQIAAWFAGTDHGIALHCGRSGAVVFDVDRPDELPAALREHLPAAPYQSTRPGTAERGHYLFAQPPGRMIGNGTGGLGGAWGEVRGKNGVIVVAPSKHPEGGQYQWLATGAVPDLPDALADLLTDSGDTADAATDAEVARFIEAHTDASRPELIHGWTSALRQKIEKGASRHNSAVSVLCGAMKEAAAGYFPAADALAALKPLFINAVGLGDGARTGSVAEGEWNGIVAWAVGQANSADPEDTHRRVGEKMPTQVAEISDAGGGAGESWSPRQTATATAEATPDSLHSGQLRMAYRLADSHNGRLLHVHGIGWHYYDGKRWAYDDTGAAKRAVCDVLRAALAGSLGDKELRADVRKCESASGTAGVLELAAALEPFAATVRDLDADPYLLNVANGTLDLRTMELSAHNPADRLTKVTRAAYRPGDTQPGEWARFLQKVLPDEAVRAYVQRQTGVALVGKVVEHVLSIWTGRGANGKGTCVLALCFALGDYASTAEPELLLHRQGAHPTGEMDLMGRRFVVMSETDDSRKMAEATMKRLTGGDTIRARPMRQDFIEFEPSHTPILVTNHLPVVSGDDPAVWRRIRVVPFDVNIPRTEQNEYLGAQLQADADAILAWALAGWTEYERTGLAEPDAVVAKTNRYQSESDAVGRFIADCCVTSSPVLKATTKQLFEAWQQWRISDGAEEVSQKAFGKSLDRHGYPATATVNSKRWRQGIALREGDSNG